MMLLIGAVFALISTAAAAYSWVTLYDQRLRMETMEQRVQSLQGVVGNLKQNVRADAQKILREEIEAGTLQESGSGSASDLQAVMLQMMLNGGMQPMQSAEPQSVDVEENGRAKPPGMLGRGGDPE